MLDWNSEDIELNRPELFGHILENYVATELKKSGTVAMQDFRASGYLPN